MTGWFFPWGKTKERKQESFDVEKYLKDLGDGDKGLTGVDEDVRYIKSINVSRESAVEDTIKELERANIVVLNIGDMLHCVPALRDILSRIRRYCSSNGGDLCRISETKVMVVPNGVEIAYTLKED